MRLIPVFHALLACALSIAEPARAQTMSAYAFSSAEEKTEVLSGARASVLAEGVVCEGPASCVAEMGTFLTLAMRPQNLWLTTFSSDSNVCGTIAMSLNAQVPASATDNEGHPALVGAGFWKMLSTPHLEAIDPRATEERVPAEVRDRWIRVNPRELFAARVRDEVLPGWRRRNVDAKIESEFPVSDNETGLAVRLRVNGQEISPLLLFTRAGEEQGLLAALARSPTRFLEQSRLLYFSEGGDDATIFDRPDAPYFVDGEQVRILQLAGRTLLLENVTRPRDVSALTTSLDLSPGQHPIVPRAIVSELRGPTHRIVCEFVSRFALWNALVAAQDVPFSEFLRMLGGNDE